MPFQPRRRLIMTIFSNDQVRRMREDWASGDYDLEDIKQKYGVGHGNMHAILKGNTRTEAPGPVFKSLARRPGIEDRIKECYEKGMTIPVTAEKLRLTDGFVRKVHKELGLACNFTNSRAGENGNTAKLTETDVRKIRILYSIGGYSIGALVKIFPAKHGAIHSIVRRKNWKHVL